MPRKAKKIVSQEARENMRLGQLKRQAKRRAEKQNAEWEVENYVNNIGVASLSAAAVSPATEISFVKSSVLARKEAARQTIEDCDALLTAWDRLGI